MRILLLILLVFVSLSGFCQKSNVEKYELYVTTVDKDTVLCEFQNITMLTGYKTMCINIGYKMCFTELTKTKEPNYEFSFKGKSANGDNYSIKVAFDKNDEMAMYITNLNRGFPHYILSTYPCK